MQSPCFGPLGAVSQDHVPIPHAVLLVIDGLLSLGTGPNDPCHFNNMFLLGH